MVAPTKYTEEMQELADQYLADCPDVLPSIVGLAVHLNVVTKTLYNWAEKPDQKMLLHTLCKIKDRQHHTALNGGMDNTFNATITKLVLANHGYHDSSKVEQKIELSTSELSDGDLEDIIHGDN